MKKLVLIDSNAIIHRAYHSMPKNMSTSRGELTGVVYGYATTLIKVIEDLHPDYIAASFDLSGPTFRHREYKEYKANRVKADQELYDQIPRVRELVSMMGIPIYEKKGFEADDVIGTITKQVSNCTNYSNYSNQNPKPKSKPDNDGILNPPFAQGYGAARQAQNDNKKKLITYDLQLMTYIVSGDKDIFQLVNGNVFVYNLKKGLSQTQIVDKEVIKKDYDLEPEDFIDLKALAGDASDNIPGVPGIGPKTATQLIIGFDSLDKLYTCVEGYLKKNNLTILDPKLQKPNKFQVSNSKGEDVELKSRIIRLLMEHKDQAFMSQKLATIHKDVPIDFSLEESKFGEYDKGKLKQFFEELGFRSLLKRYGASNITDKQINEETTKPKISDKQLKLL